VAAITVTAGVTQLVFTSSHAGAVVGAFPVWQDRHRATVVPLACAVGALSWSEFVLDERARWLSTQPRRRPTHRLGAKEIGSSSSPFPFARRVVANSVGQAPVGISPSSPNRSL
jgi:hypothetical protein